MLQARVSTWAPILVVLVLGIVPGKAESVCAEETVVAGTTVVAGIVRNLTSANEPIRVLIPAQMCPGHFDARPGDIRALSGAACLIIQPWQRQMPNVRAVIRAAALPEERVHVVEVAGSWMVPSTYADAVPAMATLLGKLRPDEAVRLLEKAQEQRKSALEFGARVKNQMAKCKVDSVNVLCNEMQAELVGWAGFNIIGAFGRGEDLSVAEVERLVRIARDGGVVLVVDNLQSGSTRTSEMIARDCGAEHVVLSNFPGAFPNTETWEAALQQNADRLLSAVTRLRKNE